jgi:hypothetical protein
MIEIVGPLIGAEDQEIDIFIEPMDIFPDAVIGEETNENDKE